MTEQTPADRTPPASVRDLPPGQLAAKWRELHPTAQLIHDRAGDMRERISRIQTVLDLIVDGIGESDLTEGRLHEAFNLTMIAITLIEREAETAGYIQSQAATLAA